MLKPPPEQPKKPPHLTVKSSYSQEFIVYRYMITQFDGNFMKFNGHFFKTIYKFLLDITDEQLT